jgi:hypothetical protein
VDLEKFTQRPITVADFQWLSTAAGETELFVLKFPDCLLTDTVIAKKLANIAFFRPNVEITIRINGTPMHYGRLMFAYLHQATQINASYKTFGSLFCADWKQVSASQQQDTKFIVPYAHIKDRTLIVTDPDYDIFTLYCYVAVPLRNYSTATPPSIGVTIFARFVDLQLAGYLPDPPLPPPVFTPQMLGKTQTKNVRAIKGDGDGKESKEKSMLSEVGDFVTDATSVVSKVAKGISSGAKDVMGAVGSIASIASFFGLSVPPNSASTNPMQISMPKWSYYEDLPLTNVLGNNTMDQIEYNVAKVSSMEDENVLLNYCMRPCLLTQIGVDNTMPAGQNIYVQELNPLFMSYTSPLSPFDKSKLQPHPMSYLSRMFTLWRGSMRFHLSVIASRFHACRLRIVYVPVWDGTNLSIFQAEHSVNMVIDVTEETEVSFTIPYMQQTDWLEIGDYYPLPNYKSEQHSNGFLFIQVVNPLTGGASPVTPITIQLFASAGEDFQFAIPSLNNIIKKGAFKPQMYSGRSETLSINSFQAMGMSSLKYTDYPPFGNMATHWSVHDRTTSPIISFRQIANMISPLYQFSGTIDLPINLSLDANVFISPTSVNVVLFNYLTFIMSIFRYWRGSTRFVAYVPNVNFFAPGSTWAMSQVEYRPPINYVHENAASLPNWADYFHLSQAMTYSPNVDNTPIDITVPYNSIYERKFTSLPGRPTLDPGSQVLKLIISAPNDGILIGMGGGDDFALGYLLPPPMCGTITEEIPAPL